MIVLLVLWTLAGAFSLLTDIPAFPPPGTAGTLTRALVFLYILPAVIIGIILGCIRSLVRGLLG
jgi:hypothetical protein